jgi:hypothetical protein
MSVSIGARDFETSCTRLDLADCGLGVGNPAAMRELAAALLAIPHLQELDLSRNALCAVAELGEFAGVLPVLAACDSLMSLNLTDCGLGTDAATLLADSVVRRGGGVAAAGWSRLCSVSVSGNPEIRDQGMVPLLESLGGRQLDSLDLADCGLGPPRYGRAYVSFHCHTRLLLESNAHVAVQRRGARGDAAHSGHYDRAPRARQEPHFRDVPLQACAWECRQVCSIGQHRELLLGHSALWANRVVDSRMWSGPQNMQHARRLYAHDLVGACSRAQPDWQIQWPRSTQAGRRA